MSIRPKIPGRDCHKRTRIFTDCSRGILRAALRVHLVREDVARFMTSTNEDAAPLPTCSMR
jgi:hypothetical protein